MEIGEISLIGTAKVYSFKLEEETGSKGKITRNTVFKGKKPWQLRGKAGCPCLFAFSTKLGKHKISCIKT